MSIELFRFWWSVQALRVRVLRKAIMPGGNEGPNWILFAGGAAVTALSYIIGRRQKHGFDERVEEREGKLGKAQLANLKDGFDSGYTSKACSCPNSYGSVDSNFLDTPARLAELPTGLAFVSGTRTGGHVDGFHANSPHDRQQSPVPTESSEEEKSFQSSIATTQEDVPRRNLQGVLIGRTAKRDIVHRLRKQLKSRDELIMSMQVQISEYERNLSLSDAHVSELQSRLEASERSLSLSDAHISELQTRLEASESRLYSSDANVSELQTRLEAYSGVLPDVDKEVQLLRNQLADIHFDAKMEDCNQPAAGDAELVTICGDERRDMHATLLEVKQLRELLDRLEAESTAREIEWEASSKEHHSMLDKVDHLERALKEQRALVSEKQQALEMNQAELLGVTSKLQDIQHLLHVQIEETESLRRSKEELAVCVHNLTKTQDIDEQEVHTLNADNSTEIRKTDKLESNATKSNGFIKTEDIDNSEAKIPRADRLFESQDIDYDLVKIFDSVSESGSESRDSIDSQFDEMLDGTLDDLVKICSASVTPASTPKSSVPSPNSGSKKFRYF